MSRYTESIFKKSRRYGFSILETNKEFSKGKKRTVAPGQHGQRKGKLSGYGVQLQEKQKVKFMYGLNERQFRNTFARAKKSKGVLGANFLIALESRLDNLTYRLGFAMTRQGARQLVNHGHVLVNGAKIDIPSYQVKPGSIIEIRERSKHNAKIHEALNNNVATLEFVKVDKDKLRGEYVRYPERKELNQEINEALIVE